MVKEKQGFLHNAKAYANIRLIYVVILLLYTVLRQNITAVQPYVLSGWINVGITAFAVLLVLWDILIFKNIFNTKYTWVLIVFVLLTGISIAINWQYELVDNIKAFSNLCIQFFLLYISGSKKSRERINFELQTIVNSLCVVWAIAVAISVYMYFADISYQQIRYLNGQEVIVNQGFVYQDQGATVMRLWGIFLDPNVASVISIAAVLLSGYVICVSKYKWCRFLHVLNIVLQIIYIVLSNSRMALLTCYVIAFVGVWYISWNKIRKLKSGKAKEVLCIFVAAVICVGSYGAFKAVKVGLPYLRYALLSMDGQKSEEEVKIEFLERYDMEEKTDVSNGRLDKWKEGLSVFSTKPIMGIGPRSCNMVASELDPDMSIAVTTVHNSYLDVLIGNGVIGFIVLLIFFFLCLKDIIIFRYRCTEASLSVSFILLAILSILISAFFISCLFYTLLGTSILLFILLGYGMQLVQINTAETVEKKKVLFICETPYHLLNCLKLVNNLSYNASTDSDIYIYDQFPDAAAVAERLQNIGLFRNVALIKKYKAYTPVVSKAVTMFRICFPKFTLKSHFAVKQEEIRYETIAAGYFTSLLDSVKLLNPQAEIVLYEDGIGSYSIDDLQENARTGVFKLLNQLIFNGRLSYNVEKIYLNHPECYKGNTVKCSEKLSQLNDTGILKAIFNYIPNNQYCEYNTVYLTQPLKETSIGNAANMVESEILAAMEENILIRVHPRQNAAEYPNYNFDSQNNLWELECAEQITDSHILIGAFSTAQFTPKMLFDKEPTVIFTYKLYGNAFENADDTVNMLRSMYRNPEKVIVAEDMNQLTDYFKKEK